MFVFIRLFRSQSHELNLFDIEQKRMERVAKETGSKAFSSVSELLGASDTIVICTPISVTSNIIDDISRLAEKKINIVEISSLKNQSVLALRRNLETIIPVSVHPMFGPDVETFEEKTIIVVPVINQQREQELAKELFPGANLMVLDSETHDRSMALILSLPYFMNSVFMKCMANKDISLLRKIGGPTFKTQLALAHCILDEDPFFVESLIEDNVYAGDILTQYIDELKYLRRMLKSRPNKLVDYYEENRRVTETDPESTNARSLRNLFLQTQQNDQ